MIGEPDDAREPQSDRPGRTGPGTPLLVLIGFLLAVVAVVLAVTGGSMGALARIVLPSLIALLTAIASVGAGSSTIRLFSRILSEEPPERSFATRLVVGYPLLGGAMFLTALVSTHPGWLVVPVVIFGIVGFASILADLRSSHEKERVDAARLTGATVAATVLFALAIVTATLMAFLPSVSLDEVSYHLAIPKLWITEGRATELPLMSHSYFPLGTEAADLAALALLGNDGAIASHLIHLFVAIAGGIIAIRSLPGGGLGRLGVAAIASTPSILLGAGWSGTDVPLVAVTLVLFLALDRYVTGRGGLIIAGAAISAGLLVKYTFLPVAALLVGSALFAAKTRRSALLSAAGLGGAIGSIFFIRNLILTGNPLEPFLTGGGGIARFRWSGAWGETVTSYLFDTRFIDDSLGFLLPGLALGALALFRTIDSTWRRVATVAMLATAMVLTLIGPSGRILLPFLVIPAWISLAALAGRLKRGGRIAATTLLILATTVQLAVAWLHLDKLDPLQVVSGNITDRRWVALHRRSQPLIEQGNDLLDPAKRTLVLGLSELFWFDGRVTGGASFDSRRVSEYLSLPEDELAERLQEDGIEEVLVYPRLIRVGSVEESPSELQRSLVLTPEAATTLHRMLVRNAVVVRRGRDAVLYRIEP